MTFFTLVTSTPIQSPLGSSCPSSPYWCLLWPTVSMWMLGGDGFAGTCLFPYLSPESRSVRNGRAACLWALWYEGYHGDERVSQTTVCPAVGSCFQADSRLGTGGSGRRTGPIGISCDCRFRDACCYARILSGPTGVVPPYAAAVVFRFGAKSCLLRKFYPCVVYSFYGSKSSYVG